MTVRLKVQQYSFPVPGRPEPALPESIRLTPVPGSRAASDPVVVRAAATLMGQRLERKLSLLPPDAQRPARILELGTDADGGHTAVLLAAKYSRDWHPADSGYSGPDTTVVSVSHDSSVTEYARREHAGRDRVQFQTGRLLEGWPAGAPYDLIICNHVVPVLPQAWEAQCVHDGYMLMAAEVADHPGERGFLALQFDRERSQLVTMTFAVEFEGLPPIDPWPDLTREAVSGGR